MKRPIIGITPSYVSDDKLYKINIGAAKQKWSLLASDYSNALIKAGALPVILPVVDDKDYIKNILDSIDGLILSGGSDINPALSNQEMNEKVGKIEPFRDEFEYFVMDYFFNQTKKPILGICRGCQFINVFFKGTSIQDIPSTGRKTHNIMTDDRSMPHHNVKIFENTILQDIFKTQEISVNTFHHQAVLKLGNNLKISAVSSDDIVEGIEGDFERFLLGVQWHPEMMAEKYENQQKIFDYFVKKCFY